MTHRAVRARSISVNTTAQGYGQMVGGVNNTAVGNVTNPADPASEVFVVGGGTYGIPNLPDQSSNAFTVKRNGDTTVTGALLVGKGNSLGTQANATGQVVIGRYNDTRLDDGVPNHTDHTRGLLIIGNGTAGDTAHRSNALRVIEDGTVLIPEGGDISMGDFTKGPRP